MITLISLNVLLAPDKFRGSLTARQVADAMAEGVRLAALTAEIFTLPLADGGEGTAQVLTDVMAGRWHTATVSDPFGRPVEAGFGVSGDGSTAFVEMAQASGLALLDKRERDPGRANTFGTGELIQKAVEQGVGHVIMGIGGSATNDGGVGMAAAFGWQFLNQKGEPLPPIGNYLAHIRQLVPPPILPFANVKFSVACDVDNPLCGPDGATRVYGPQKGATPRQLTELDHGLRNLARLIHDQFGLDVADVPGAGAAGGLGAGALFFLNAQLRPGADVVLNAVDFDRRAAEADLILTGEGKLDHQTVQGKLIKRLVERAGKTPVVALCGTLDLNSADLNALGVRAAFSVLTKPQSLEEAVQSAYADVAQATFNVCRLFL